MGLLTAETPLLAVIRIIVPLLIGVDRILAIVDRDVVGDFLHARWQNTKGLKRARAKSMETIGAPWGGDGQPARPG